MGVPALQRWLKGWRSVHSVKVPVSNPVEMQCKHAENPLAVILSPNSCRVIGKPAADSCPAFSSFLLLAHCFHYLSLALYPVVAFKSKVKQGLNVAVESFAISTEVQETEHGQGASSKSQKWSIKDFQTKSP